MSELKEQTWLAHFPVIGQAPNMNFNLQQQLNLIPRQVCFRDVGKRKSASCGNWKPLVRIQPSRPSTKSGIRRNCGYHRPWKSRPNRTISTNMFREFETTTLPTRSVSNGQRPSSTIATAKIGKAWRW